MRNLKILISKACLFFWGWKIKGGFPESIDKIIIVVAPHRKALADILLGWFVQNVKPIPPRLVLIKGEAFDYAWGLSGWFLRKIGGFPIDRKRELSSGVPKGAYIGRLCERIESAREIAFVVTPEGTRKKSTIETAEGLFETGAPFQKGFYQIARRLNLPVALAAYDYEKKIVIIGNIFYFSGDVARDLAMVRLWYHAHVPWYVPTIDDKYFL